MQTRNSAKLTVLTAVALLGCALGISCSKTTSAGTGPLRVAFAISGGASINSASYAVNSSAGGGPLKSGVINTIDQNANVSFDVSLPATAAGLTDTVTLTATTTAGASCTGTSSPFVIVSGVPTLVNMTLICGAESAPAGPGHVIVNGIVVSNNSCPSITQAVVAPAQTSVGGSLSVSMTASDPDPTDLLTYAWAPAANFAAPTQASTSYTCTTAGAQTITLSVNDNHMGGGCVASLTFTVTCVGATTGTGGTAGGAATGTGGTAGAAGTGTGGTAGAAGTGTGGTAGAAGTGTGGTAGAAGAAVVSCGAPANGIWPDISGNGHDATLKNFSLGSGLVGDGTPANAYAVLFDGVDDFAELAPGADGLRLTTEATLEIWVNNNFAEGIASYNNMYSNRNGAEYSGFFGSIINPGNINNSQWTAGATSDGANWVLPFPTAPGRPPSATWTHFVATFSVSQGFYRLYINGVLATSTPLTAPIVYSAAAVPRVGGEAVGSNFRGEFGEIRIWGAALDASEVQARYQTGAPTYGIAAPAPTLVVTKPLALRLVAAPCP